MEGILTEIGERGDRSAPGKWQEAGTLLFYTLLSVLATWPMLLRFGSEALGEHYFDRTQNVWNLWWVKTALLNLHTNPFHTDLLLYPQGADLYFHTLNLPSTLMSLPAQLLAGPVAAYNFSMMLALVLSGYAGYRLARYLTGSFPAALVAGIIFGFSPIALFQLRGHTQMVSMQWMALCVEFYLRAWNGRDEGASPARIRRDAILMGLFFALALLTVGYYEVQLLFFFATHIVWWLVAGSGSPLPGWRDRISELLRHARPALTWGLGTALLLSAPYVIGAWASLNSGQVVPATIDDAGRALSDSVDLLSFIVPDRDHWFLGRQMPWWNGLSLEIHDLAYLGIVTLGLAIVGARSTRSIGMRRASLWIAVAFLNFLLALGPVLHLNGQATSLPMPFALIQNLPVVGLVRAPERFTISLYMALAVLAAYGMTALLSRISLRARSGRLARPLTTLAAVLFLIIEMPLHTQYTEPLPISPTITTLAGQAPRGAVLELPLTQHGWVDTNRMAYQIIHGRPITSAFLSRPVLDPYTRACSILKPFTSSGLEAADEDAQDIVTRLDDTALSALLRQEGFAYLLAYKQSFYSATGLSQVPPVEEALIQEKAQSLGTLLADDELATLYALPSSEGRPDRSDTFLQLGEGWHALEQSAGNPFRWMDGAQAELCVAAGSARSAPLQLQVASFATPRHLQLWIDGSKVYETLVPADGTLHSIETPSISWPNVLQPVQIRVPEGSVSPTEAGVGADNRQLSIGFGPITLAPPR